MGGDIVGEDIQQRASGLDLNQGRLLQGTTTSTHGAPVQPAI